MRVALVPAVRALLPRYASRADPVADLRRACLDAVSSLGPRVRVVASSGGDAEVAYALLEAAAAAPDAVDATGVLVVANGSACRTEKAPGFLDDRAEAFDDRLRQMLTEDPSALTGLDLALARELWADVDALVSLAELGLRDAEVRYDDAPYGVQYWVITWETD